MRTLWLCTAMALLHVRTSAADDAAIENVGGTVRPMNEHPSIAMVAEYVHADLHRDSVRVDCVFYLHNTGPATRIKVGFPEMATGAEVFAPSRFTNFRSWVDGIEAEVTPIDAPAASADGEHMTWWVKDVEFAADATRVVRDQYVAPPGSVSNGNLWFEYVLRTGASWAGPIGIADIVVDLEPGAEIQPYGIEPSPPHRSRNQLSWHLRDLEPGRDGRNGAVVVYWKPGTTSGGQR